MNIKEGEMGGASSIHENEDECLIIFMGGHEVRISIATWKT
jgi:hypothetical protein